MTRIHWSYSMIHEHAASSSLSRLRPEMFTKDAYVNIETTYNDLKRNFIAY